MGQNMSFLQSICNCWGWMLERLQEVWEVLVNMFLNDFRIALAAPPIEIPYEDNEPRQVNNLHSIEEDLVNITIEKQPKRHEHRSPSSEIGETSKQVTIPVMSRLQYIKSYNKGGRKHTPVVVLLEPRPLTDDSPEDTDN